MRDFRFRSVRDFVASIALVAVCWPSPLRGATVVLTPTKDNTLIERPLGDRSNALGDGIFSSRAGNTGDANFARLRAVLAFDVESAVPAGSTITSATLTLRLLMAGPLSGDDTHTLHRLLADWGEGTSSAFGGSGAPSTTDDATWLHRFFPDTLWTTIGGDFDATPSASHIVGQTSGFYSWTSAQMASDVQGWLDDPASNFGWLILGNEIDTFTARKFASKDNVNASIRPMLTIEFTPPCPADVAPAKTGGDGQVNVSDLLLVIAEWGNAGSPADINGDNIVNVSDLLAVIAAWGPCE